MHSDGRVDGEAHLTFPRRDGFAVSSAHLVCSAVLQDVMDGMECTRVIRSQQLPHRVRPYIIAQTANVTEEYKIGCFESGMDHFICKVSTHERQEGIRVHVISCLCFSLSRLISSRLCALLF